MQDVIQSRSKKLIVTILLTLSIVGVLVFTAISGSWFQDSKTTSGTIQFGNAVILGYDNMSEKANSTTELYLIPAGESSSNDGVLTTGARPGDVISFENPVVFAAEGSSDFYLRVKIVYTNNKYGDNDEFDYIEAGPTFTSNWAQGETSNGVTWYYFKGNKSLTGAYVDTVAELTRFTYTAQNNAEYNLFTTATITLADFSSVPEDDVTVSIVFEAIQATDNAVETLWFPPANNP